MSYRALCTPFLAAWSKPEAQRSAALDAWQGAIIAKVAGDAPRAKMQKLLVRIKEQHDERLKRRALFWRQLLNSVVIAFFTTLLGVFLACTAAYAFSRFRFPGREAGLMSFLVSQMFPGTLMMIPLYILMSRLGLLNSLLGLTLVYSTTSIPFCVWMLKGYFDTIPKEIEEAALMDGASRTLIFLRIILPLARPAIAVTALFSFMTAWNEFILAATFMNDEKHYTLPVMLQSFAGSYNTEWGHFAAGAILVSVPIILLFFALQKNLVGGLTAGSVKG
ncbi:MAG: sugar ABC transporter permease [Myxococcales bacterium]|nr:sugar ABC transporter permease [Myxococcales bacterium]